MRGLSLTVKYSVLIMFSTLSTSGLLSWFFLDQIRSDLQLQLVRRGEAASRQLAYMVAPLLLGKDDAKIGAALNNILKDPDITWVNIVDADDHMVAASDPLLKGTASVQAGPRPQDLSCGDRVEDKALGRSVFSQASTFGGVQVGCVFIELSHASLRQTIAQATARVLYLTATIAALVLAIAFITLRRALRPLSQVIEGTRRIAEGDFSARIPLKTHDEVGELASAFNGMAARTELFFRYLDKSIIERLIQDEELARPGGRLKPASVLFGDMREFTALSNERSPSDVVWILNTYFSLFFEIVHHHDGVVDKTMGDAIMAFFEPYRSSDTSHSIRAAMAAVSMRASVWVLKEVLAEANRSRVPVRLVPCDFGFSVATGRLIIGNIGSSLHLDYTVCGQAVNLASRLQEDTRGGEVILDRFTAMDVEELVSTSPLPRVLPKGFQPTQEVTPYLVTGLKEIELVRLRQLLRHLFSRTYFLEKAVPEDLDGRVLQQEERDRIADQLFSWASSAIDRDPPSFLIKLSQRMQ